MSPLKTAVSDLTGLYSIFGDTGAQVPRARFIQAEEMPEPYRALLAHHHHMTVTMEEHCGSPVDVKIIRSIRDDPHYARKIVLTKKGTNDVVMFGIMRFNFDWCSPEIKEKIAEGKTPLGRILIENDVLRRISTHATLRIIPNMEMRACFGIGPEYEGEAEEYVYGRLATIFCNEEPAVDLLEVVSPKA